MKNRYSMIIQWSDEDQLYVVTLPEFPTCQTHGSTYEEAAKNGCEVLELLLETYVDENKQLPKPVTLQDSPDFWEVFEELQKTSPVSSSESA